VRKVMKKRNCVFSGVIALVFVAMGCESAKPSPVEEVDRCDAAATKVAELWGGGEDARADAYKRMVVMCTPGPDEELSAHGVKLLSCIDRANNGAAARRCELEFEHGIKESDKEEASEKFVELFRKLYNHSRCGGDVSIPDKGALDALEVEARNLGVTDAEVTAMLQRAASEEDKKPPECD